MSTISTTHRWKNRLAVAVAGLGWLLTATQVLGQPAYGPPAEITSDEALKRLGGPTSVTVTLRDASPEDILGTVAAQAGIDLDAYSAREHFQRLGNVSVDFSNRPIWEVVEELSRKWEVSIKPRYEPDFRGSPSGVTLAVAPGRDADLMGPRCERSSSPSLPAACPEPRTSKPPARSAARNASCST